MPKYFVDFEFIGHVAIAAKNEEEAVETVKGMSIDDLIDYIQHFSVGKHYAEKQAQLNTQPIR